MTVRCRKCNTKNPATNEFCGKCGERLYAAQPEATEVTETTEAAAPATRRRPNIVAIVATVAILAVFGACIIGAIIGSFKTQELANAQNGNAASAQVTQALLVQTPNPTFGALAGNVATALVSSKKLIIGPANDTLQHSVENGATLYDLVASLSDFIVEARFYNIYGAGTAWGYGFLFRSSQGSEYFFDVTSNAHWSLQYGADTQSKSKVTEVGTGLIDGMNTAPNATNTLRLIAKSDRIEVFINDTYVTTALTPLKTTGGAVKVVIHADTAAPVPDSTRHFDNLNIWSLS